VPPLEQGCDTLSSFEPSAPQKDRVTILASIEAATEAKDQSRYLSRADVIGRRIVAIYSRCEESGAHIYDDTVLVLDSGLAFRPPLADFLPQTITPPFDPRLKNCKLNPAWTKSPISKMLLFQDDGGWIDSSSLVFVLESGATLEHSCIAPGGLPWGLRLHPAGVLQLDGLTDYWSVH
jgi:hypothetical protein